MCGRYSLFVPPEQLEDQFDLDDVSPYEPRYNAAPSQSLPVVTDDQPRTLRRLEWGLIPPWAEQRSDGGHINARAETLTEKPSFSDPFEQHTDAELAVGRCLVPADGFYEWTETSAGKQPFRVTLTEEKPFAMAGLWAQWRPATTQTGLDAFTDGGEIAGDEPDAAEPEVVETFTIVTTDPNAVVEPLHHRMAVILPETAYDQWLSAPPEEAARLLSPFPPEEMRSYPVSTAVNNPANDGPDLVEEVEPLSATNG
jgi:putative SOS response-associated peptidase YedK